MDLIKEGLIWICLSLDNFVYSLIMFAYQIILVLARINLFEERTALDDFISRVYIIIGVVMLFLLAYSLLRGMINPDEALKGKNSPQKTIFNVLSSVVLIALVPYAFSVAMDFQNAILQQGTLNSIILGSATENAEGSNNINDGGFSIASGIFQAFYHPSTEGNYCQYFGDTKLTESEDCAEVLLLGESYTYDAFWDLVKSTGSFYLLPNTNTDVVDGKIEYNWLISTAVGVFVLVVLVGYCVDIAIRSIKLAVYQLIAPLPILARILPNEQGSKTFSNWLKACISTYLEVFIRLAILFFIVLIITILNDNIGQIFEPFNSGGGVVIGFVAWAFLIVGLIMFMKQLPNIIKDITGLDSGKYKLFGGLKDLATGLKTGTAFVGGAVAGRSLAAGARAAKSTFKDGNLTSVGDQYKRRLAKARAKQEGATFVSRKRDSFRRMFGMPSLKEMYDTETERNVDPTTGKSFVSLNQSGKDIILPDGTEIKAGGAIKLDAKNVQLLEQTKALNEQRKADIAETVRNYKLADDSNMEYKKHEDKMKEIASKEIAKGKYFVRDESGKTIDLTYVDSATGKTVSSKASGMRTQKELESWLERAKHDMSAEEYGQLSRKLTQAVTKFTVDSFIQNNGADKDAKVGPNIQLTDEKKSMMTSLINNGGLFTIDEKTGRTTKFVGIDDDRLAQELGFKDSADSKAKARQIETIIRDINNGVRSASSLTRDEITLLSDVGSKYIHSLVSHNMQLQNEQKEIMDEENNIINNLFDQSKKAAEAFKAGKKYKAAEAANRANNIENSGKK